MRKLCVLMAIACAMGLVLASGEVAPAKQGPNSKLKLSKAAQSRVEMLDRMLTKHANFSKTSVTKATAEAKTVVGHADTVGDTRYEMQHNTTCARNIAVDNAGGVHMSWMRGTDPPNFTNRHIYYNYFDPSTRSYLGDVEGIQCETSSRAGYTSLALASLPPNPTFVDTTAARVEVPIVAFHAGYTSGISGIHSDVTWDLFRFWGTAYRGTFGGMEATASPYRGSGSMPPTITSDSLPYDCPRPIDVEPIWPHIDSDETGRIYMVSCNSQDTICDTLSMGNWVLYTTGTPHWSAGGTYDTLLYYDFFEAPLAIDPQSSISGLVVSDPTTPGKLALLYTSYISEYENDCPDSLWSSFYPISLFIRYSTDYGVTWGPRQVVMGNALNPGGMPTPATTFQHIDNAVYSYVIEIVGTDTTFGYYVAQDTITYSPCPWGSPVAAVFDKDGVLHVAALAYLLGYHESAPCDSASMYYSTGLFYWNSDDANLIPIETIVQGRATNITNNSTTSISTYEQMFDPAITVDNYGNPYIIYTQSYHELYELEHDPTMMAFMNAHMGDTLTDAQFAEYDSLWSEIFAAEGCTTNFDISAGATAANLDVFGFGSTDGGRTWASPTLGYVRGTNLTKTFSSNCAAGRCLCELNVTTAKYTYADSIHMFYVLDKDAGISIRGSSPSSPIGSYTLNPVIHHVVHKNGTIYGGVGIKETPSTKPTRLSVSSYPNPFNAATLVSFETNSTANVKVDVLDVTGRIVKTLTSGTLTAGAHSVIWDGTDDAGKGVATGVYMCRVKAGDHVNSTKLTLVK